jgi:hypothetical protein
MSADRISTSGQIVLKSETFGNDLRTGSSTVRVFTGSKANVTLQQHVEVGFGASITKIESLGDGNYQLTAQYAFDMSGGGGQAALPVNSHELENNMERVDVWTNKNLRATFLTAFRGQAAANAALAFVVRKVDNFIQAGDGSAAAQAAAEALITGYAGYQACMLNAFRGVAYHQIKNCIQFDSIYRRRITAASYNQVQAAFTGAEQIWTTAEVIAFENTPSLWWFHLPSTYLWLKAPPVVNTIAQQKTEILYTYMAVSEAWGLLYTAYGTATLLNF